MNALAVPFRQLVERRLWPLAALLIAALVAVPVLLSKSVAQPAPPAPVASTQGETEAIVSLSDPGDRESVRKVLGSRKNPFRPAVAAKAAPKKAETAPAAAAGAASPADAGDKGGTSSGGAVSAPSTPVAPAPVSVPVVDTPLAPKKTYELYSLKVRFGDSSAETLAASQLKRLTALPSNEDAAVIYLGLLKDRKTAVFLVDGDARVQGDGACKPSPRNCETLEMKAGDTAFIDVGSEEAGTTQQFQLDLVAIRTKKTTDADAARRSYVSVARGGRAALRSRMSRVGGLQFDAHVGLVARPRK